MDIETKAERAKKAQIVLGNLGAGEKSKALDSIAEALLRRREEIEAANIADIEQAQAERLAPPLLKRLKLQGEKIDQAVLGVKSVAALEDPSGKTLEARRLDDGLSLYRVSCPIGVIGMIFESRPDALVQMAALCLKSGNGVLLKGGSEALRTNRLLVKIIGEAVQGSAVFVPEGWISLLESREDVGKMLALSGYIDLLIPRGSNSFVRYIMDNTSIPVLGHAEGVTHLFVDAEADADMAVRIAEDSKLQYVAVCNALETLLVDRAVAAQFLPLFKERMDARGAELRGCPETRRIVECARAEEEDWSTEYLAPVLSIRIVGGLDEAVEHIHTYGSGHTDGIVTQNRDTAEKFMNLVDSADVMWNCSTRFSDGYRYGLGAEVGISTNKIHARGPVGLDGLVIYKWKLYGDGHVVSDYTAEGGKTFLHQEIKGMESRS
ncbi:MAG: glutamate-5-semialdehyde dehydrogenase [Spirochaetaceae bacterium]